MPAPEAAARPRPPRRPRPHSCARCTARPQPPASRLPRLPPLLPPLPLLLLLLSPGPLPLARPAAADAPSAVNLRDLADSYWTPSGLRLPSRQLAEAVRSAALPCVDGAGRVRRLVIMTLASKYAFNRMFGIFMESLANITFPRADGSTASLARHTIVNVMNAGGLDRCVAVAGAHGARCVGAGSAAFTAGNFDVHSNDFYGIGFAKTAAVLDGLSLGADVLFLDADQVLFRNPLPYLLAREADVMVSGDCHHHGDDTPQERLPPINNNIGFVYFRPTPMVTRAVYGWAAWLAAIARRGEKPWDQNTFAGAMERVAADVTVRHLSMAMLRPDLFPYLCMAQCGCDLRGVPYFHNGRLPRFVRDIQPATCEATLMEGWYAFHMPCAGDSSNKATLMDEYARMYQRVVGPINSRSAPLQAL